MSDEDKKAGEDPIGLPEGASGGTTDDSKPVVKESEDEGKMKSLRGEGKGVKPPPNETQKPSDKDPKARPQETVFGFGDEKLNQVEKKIKEQGEASIRPDRNDRRTAAEMRKNYVGSGVIAESIETLFQEISNVTQTVFNISLGAVESSGTRGRTVQHNWELVEFDRTLAFEYIQFLIPSARFNQFREDVVSGTSRIRLMVGADLAHLKTITQAVCVDLPTPVKRLLNFSHKLMIGFVDEQRLREERAERVEEAERKLRPEPLELYDHYYLIENCPIGTLNAFSLGELRQLESYLAKRGMGLILSSGVPAARIPDAWKPFTADLPSVDAPAQIMRFLESVPELSDDEKRHARERLSEDPDVSAYLKMQLNFDDCQAAAAMLIRGLRENDLQERFTKLRSYRIAVLLERWFEENRDDYEAYATLFALAALDGLQMSEIEGAAKRFLDLLRKAFPQFDLPQAAPNESPDQAFSRQRAELIKQNPFGTPQKARLDRFMVERDTLNITDAEDERRRAIEIVRFKYREMAAYTLRYFWREFERAREQMCEWFHNLRKEWPIQISQYAARALGILAVNDFYTIENIFIRADDPDYVDAEIQTRLEQAVTRELPTPEQIEGARKNRQDKFKEWNIRAEWYKTVFWWAYQSENTQTQDFIKDCLERWAADHSLDAHMVIAVACYGRVGAYFIDESLTMVDRIAHIPYMAKPEDLPALDLAFVRNYQRLLEKTPNQVEPESRRQKHWEEQLATLDKLQSRLDEQQYFLPYITNTIKNMLIETVLMTDEVGQGWTHEQAEKYRERSKRAQRAILKLIYQWVRKVEADLGLMWMGLLSLDYAAREPVKSCLPEKELERFSRWKLLMYVTQDEDQIAELAGILRFMLRSAQRERVFDIVTAAVEMVNVKEDARTPFEKQRAYLYCKLLVWHIAFDKEAMRSDRDMLAGRFTLEARRMPNESERRQGKKNLYKPVWEALAAFLNAD